MISTIQPIPVKQVHSTPPSPFRTVFGSDPLRAEFSKFLNTIFYQLDDKKVLREIDLILKDPSKSDAQIYEEIVQSIDRMRSSYPAIFEQLKALHVLQKGMGIQVAELTQNLRPETFVNYLEVYFRRYVKTIQKTAHLALNGNVFDLSNAPPKGSIQERLEAGALVSSYPYKTSIPLNDADCTDPDLQPEKTHKPIGAEVEDKTLDCIGCLGGLHHIPQERVAPFVESMARTLRPGGIVLLRDHDVTTPELFAIASVVHSFVNATSGVSLEVEKKEVRAFHSAEYWTDLMQAHHFVRLSPDNLVLPEDPTQNGMMIFAKKPETLEELRQAVRYRKEYLRAPNNMRATWIEWGNVRYSKQFAAFTQTRHAYAFDYLGHLKQHWNYFTSYLQESRQEFSLKEIVGSGQFVMNVFILAAAAVECTTGYVSSVPSQVIARMTQGVNWRNATDLTALEKYGASVDKEYSEFIDHTPFYCFPYASKIKGLWSAIRNSPESTWTKSVSALSAAGTSISLGLKSALCAPIRALYMQDGTNVEPDKVSVLLYDPENQIKDGKAIFQTPDGYKAISMPRYRPLTKFLKELSLKDNVRLLELGNEPQVTVDVLYKKGETTLQPQEANLLYEMDKLQDLEEKRHATYQVAVEKLQDFANAVGAERIDYIHE
jgi:SAM-dependent methyltransferase